MARTASTARAGCSSPEGGGHDPRHLRFGPDGALYVAEAGVGGDQPATECPPVDNMFTQDGPYVAGFTGRISKIKRDGSFRYVADISAFIRANPVANEPLCGQQGDCEPDGVPHSLLADDRWLYVVETNHNSVLRVDPRTGTVRRIYDLSVQDPAPIIMVRRGDGFLLGGFDGLIQGFSDRFGPVRTVEDGFGPITDLAFAGGRLHVLETFSGEPFSANSGRIVRRSRNGRRTVIAERLNFPVGMAVGGGPYRRGLYVTTVGNGQGPVRGLGRIVRVRRQ
jgi:hypothetical protein